MKADDSTSTDHADRGERLDRAVTEYLQAVDAGQSPDPQEWIARYPDLAEELRDYLAGAQQFHRLSTTLQANPVHLGTGHCFGDYELLEEIARGGMGVVYKARQLSLNRLVALKMLLTGPFAGDNDVQRFRTEAEAAAKLDHPNILPIYEVGDHGGLQYYTMKLIDGGSLAGRIREWSGQPRQAVELLIEVARGAHHAHQRGILHRDLKPSNILLSGNTPYIADFGLARKVEGDSKLTQTGAIVGTPFFMAPEQAAAHKDLTTAIDVYALGAILYEMLTGQPPFSAPTAVETIIAVLEQEPIPPRALRSSVDRDLETIALKCLERVPQNRFDSAAALADDLERWQRGEPILARRASTTERLVKWVRRNTLVSVLLAAVLLVLLTGMVVSSYFAVTASEAATEALQAQATAQAEKDRADRKAEDTSREAARADREARSARREAARMTLAQGLRLCEQEQEGHQGVLWLARSLDHAVAAGDKDLERAIRLNLAEWTRVIPQVRWRLAHPDAVGCVVISQDGKLMATGCADKVVRLWDAESGELLPEVMPHASPIICLALSPDGRTLVSGCADGQVTRWDVKSRKSLGKAQRHMAEVTDVVFSPDGTMLLTASKDHAARLWDASTGAPLASSFVHPDHVWSVAFSPDNKRFVTGADGSSIRVWDIATRQQVLNLSHNSWGCLTVACSPDGQLIAGAVDGGIQFWNAQTGLREHRIPHESSISHISFSADGKHLALTGQGANVQVREVATGKRLSPSLLHEGDTRRVAFSPDGTTVAASCVGKMVCVWHLVPPRTPQVVMKHIREVNAVAFSPDGKSFVTGGVSGMVHLWDRETGKPLRTWGHLSRILSLAYSPDNKLILAGGDSITFLWEIATGREYVPPMSHTQSVWNVCFSPDGKQFAGGTWSPFVQVGDTHTGKPTGLRVRHGGLDAQQATMAVAFHPEGDWLLTGGVDCRLRTWDLRTGQPARDPIKLHRESLSHIAFSADGKQFATASFDGTAQVWDSRTLKPVGQSLVHRAMARDVVFTPDGRCVVTASDDQTARLWDVATGTRIGPPFAHAATVYSVDYSPHHNLVLTGSLDRTACLWDVAAPLEGPVEQVRLWVELLTGTKLEDNGTYTVLDAEAFAATRRRLGELGGPPSSAPAHPANSEIRQAPDADAKVAQAWSHFNQGISLRDKGQVNEAIAAYRRAIEINPMFSWANNNLGTALYDKGQVDEAIIAFRRAIEIEPNYALAYNNLGNALTRQGKWEDAVGAYRQAIALGHATAQTGVARAQRLAALQSKLSDYRKGDYQPTKNDEKLALAELAWIKQLHQTSVTLYTAAFGTDPKLPGEGNGRHRYNAACNAALAAAGKGADANTLDDRERARLRTQALDWLRAELELQSKQIDHAAIRRTMNRWQADDDLASLRDETALAKLAPAERAAYAKLWTEVATLAQRTMGVEVQRFVGSKDGVACLALSPDGKRMVSGCWGKQTDHLARIWDLTTGADVLQLKGHSSGVSCVAWSKSGKRILTGGLDGAIWLWDAETGQSLLTIPNAHDGGSLHSVLIDEDGGKAVSCATDRSIRVWDLGTGKQQQCVDLHSAAVRGLAWVPGNKRIVSAGFDRTVRLIDLDSGKEIRRMGDSPLQAAAWFVAMSPDGTRIASVGADKMVRLWDVATGKQIKEFAEHIIGGVHGIAYSRDGKRLLSGGYDGTVRLWDIASGKETYRIQLPDGIRCVAFSNDDEHAVIACYDGTLRLWKLPK